MGESLANVKEAVSYQLSAINKNQSGNATTVSRDGFQDRECFH